MNIKQAAQMIRDMVETRVIVELYGYNIRRDGFMICPFHGDKDASLKVYPGNRGWCCYGCHREGSVIDFVMEHERCNFHTAVRAIDESLHLHLLDPYEDPFKAEDQSRIQDWLDDFANAIYSYLDAVDKVICYKFAADLKKYKQIRDKDVKDRTADECTYLLTYDDEQQYNEYRLDKIKEFREEVAAWRRKARRARLA